MNDFLSRIVFKGLGKLGVRTRSEIHESDDSRQPDLSAAPIVVLGFARTGTTTAQAILARAFDYNTVFEPFGFNHGSLDSFERANEFFSGNPLGSQRRTWLENDEIPGAIHTTGNDSRRQQLRGIFDSHCNAVYQHYGLNVVFKEIRIISSLTSLIAYHLERGINVVFVGIEAHPFQPLYTYYRLGGVSRSDNPSRLRVEDLYRYRVATYEKLELFENIRRLPVRSAADCFLISILLDQAYLREKRENGDLHWLVRLNELPRILAEIGDQIGLTPCREDLPVLRESNRFVGDSPFQRRVLSKVGSEIWQFIESEYGELSIQGVKGPGWRGFFTAVRHDLFCSDRSGTEET